MQPFKMTATTWTLRQALLVKYGGVCTCACGCRESRLKQLQLHHIHGQGTDERKKMRGMNFYTKLSVNPTDPGLQILCVGCHWEVTIWDVCERGVQPEVQHNENHGLRSAEPVVPGGLRHNHGSEMNGSESVEPPLVCIPDATPEVKKGWFRRRG